MSDLSEYEDYDEYVDYDDYNDSEDYDDYEDDDDYNDYDFENIYPLILRVLSIDLRNNDIKFIGTLTMTREHHDYISLQVLTVLETMLDFIRALEVWEDFLRVLDTLVDIPVEIQLRGDIFQIGNTLQRVSAELEINLEIPDDMDVLLKIPVNVVLQLATRLTVIRE